MKTNEDKKYAGDFRNWYKTQLASPARARFIWNAEISVSVAIHCYERLF